LSYNTLGKLVTEHEPKKEEKRSHYNQYLTNQVFRKTYVNVKRQIDDWLRKVS